MVLAVSLALLFAQNRLQIEVLEGQGAINNITRRTAFEPVVRVMDESGAPVAGAVVTFILPVVGASGVFVDGAKVLSIQTDEAGRAVARGLRPNNVVGRFEIRVNATYGRNTASTTILQTNAASAHGSSSRSKKLLILALVGGGIAGGVAAAMGSKGSSSPAGTPPSGDTASGVITPGAPTFGPPH